MSKRIILSLWHYPFDFLVEFHADQLPKRTEKKLEIIVDYLETDLTSDSTVLHSIDS